MVSLVSYEELRNRALDAEIRGSHGELGQEDNAESNVGEEGGSDAKADRPELQLVTGDDEKVSIRDGMSSEGGVEALRSNNVISRSSASWCTLERAVVIRTGLETPFLRNLSGSCGRMELITLDAGSDDEGEEQPSRSRSPGSVVGHGWLCHVRRDSGGVYTLRHMRVRVRSLFPYPSPAKWPVCRSIHHVGGCRFIRVMLNLALFRVYLSVPSLCSNNDTFVNQRIGPSIHSILYPGTARKLGGVLTTYSEMRFFSSE